LLVKIASRMRCRLGDFELDTAVPHWVQYLKAPAVALASFGGGVPGTDEPMTPRAEV
jgi:hypothetical protein